MKLIPLTKIDLSDLRDDKTVQHNPHKGWYIHYVDNGFSRPFYRDSIQKGDHLEQVLGINHLYIRFDWQDVEPEEGKVDWSCIEQIISEWHPFGFTFALRLCTYEANSHLEFATPSWVFEAGAKSVEIERINRFDGESEHCREPDYGNSIFIEKLCALLKSYGKQFNGRPEIEFIDVGTFGTFGEGHTSGGSNRTFSLSVIHQHIDLHAINFPNTRILVNDDMLRHSAGSDLERAKHLSRYCMLLNMGIRDDSALVSSCAREESYHTLRAPELFDEFFINAPVDIESTHQRFVSPDIFCEGYPFYEALKRSHATYAGFHGNVYEWLRAHGHFHSRMANLLGYWYFIESIMVPRLKVGMNGTMILWINNAGFAPSYHDFAFHVRTRKKDSPKLINIIASLYGLNRKWLPDMTIQESIPLITQMLPEGEYYLDIGMFAGDKPVRFAMRDEYYMEDDFCCVGYFELQPPSIKLEHE